MGMKFDVHHAKNLVRRLRRPSLARAIEASIQVVLAFALLGELAVVFLNVVSRIFSGASLPWTDEAAEMALSSIAFLGGAAAYRRQEHASIRALVDLLSPRGRQICLVLTEWVVLLIAITGGWVSIPYFLAQSEQLTPVLQVPASWFVLPLVIGMIAIAATAVERLAAKPRTIALTVGSVVAAIIVIVTATEDVWRPWFVGDAALNLALGLFFAAVLLGLPVAFALLLGALSYLYLSGTVPLVALAQTMVNGISNFVLLALPFFVLAAVIMNHGGISLRLVRFVQALVGHFRGGLLQVMVVSMYLVSGLSGAKSADVAAVGSVMRDMLRHQGYSLEQSTAVLASSAAMGETVPPSIAMLVLGSVTTLSIGALFIAGLIPAAVVAVCLMALIYVQAWRTNTPRSPRARVGELVRAAFGGTLPLLMPVFLLGGIILGVATPTEVSSFAVVYGLVLSAVVYRELGMRDFVRGVVDCAAMSGLILFILAAASSFAWALTVAHLPQRLVGLLAGVHQSQWVFLLVSIALLIVAGSILEGLPALLILAPLLMPIATKVGVNDLHYGIVLVIAMGIGAFMPPVGVGFYIACAVCGTTIERSARAMIPFVIVLCLGLLVVALVPWFTLFLPATLHFVK
jgi:tripartite ATP-independent transporter DctM subunit